MPPPELYHTIQGLSSLILRQPRDSNTSARVREYHTLRHLSTTILILIFMVHNLPRFAIRAILVQR